MKHTNKSIKRSRLKLPSTYLFILVPIIVGLLIGIGIKNYSVLNTNFDATITYSTETIPAKIYNDRGEVIETTEYNGEQIPTVDEVDGGRFEDETSGISSVEDYEDLGSVIETFPTSTPEAFRDATLTKCIYASNKYGAQCVSLARSFWWSYANRDVSTCGTGMAKGMMNCTDYNAGDDFEVHWGNSNIQDGDWLVADGGQYGHICMALGSVNNGYVACLGENQGGKKCDKGGSATNIINYNVKNVIGFYRPKAYIKPVPTPTPIPIPLSGCKDWHVKKGDTMSNLMLSCEGIVIYGEAMNNYANSWISQIYNKGKSVYYGWSHNGYGLYAGDYLIHKMD